MFKKILNTFLSKTIVAICSFFILILTTQYLGASGRGLISLLTASIGILSLVSGFIGGNALVYLIPKNESKTFLKHVLIFSYLWIIIVSSFGIFILFFIGSLPENLIKHILVLSILLSVFTTNRMVLLAKEKVIIHNASITIQIILNLSVFGLMIIILKSATVNIFIYSLYFSYAAGIIFISLFLLNIWKSLKKNHSAINLLSNAKKIIKYGFISQLGYVLHYLNYRLSYYILNYYRGLAEVGIYSVGVNLTVVIFMIARSISLVQYSKIANTGDNSYSKDLTINLTKISFVITFICLVTLLIIPTDIFTFIFGKDFSQVKNVVFYLSIGIICFGFSVILNHYFAGTGRYYINTIASSLGFLVTIAGNILLVPKFGFMGAGITASIAYLITSIFQLLAFIKITKISINNFFRTRTELLNLIKIIRKK